MRKFYFLPRATLSLGGLGLFIEQSADSALCIIASPCSEAEGSCSRRVRVSLAKGLHFVCLNWDPLMIPMLSVRYFSPCLVDKFYSGNVISPFSFYQQQPPYDTCEASLLTELCKLLFSCIFFFFITRQRLLLNFVSQKCIIFSLFQEVVMMMFDY